MSDWPCSAGTSAAATVEPGTAGRSPWPARQNACWRRPNSRTAPTPDRPHQRIAPIRQRVQLPYHKGPGPEQSGQAPAPGSSPPGQPKASLRACVRRKRLANPNLAGCLRQQRRRAVCLLPPGARQSAAPRCEIVHHQQGIRDSSADAWSKTILWDRGRVRAGGVAVAPLEMLPPQGRCTGLYKRPDRCLGGRSAWRIPRHRRPGPPKPNSSVVPHHTAGLRPKAALQCVPALLPLAGP